MILGLFSSVMGFRNDAETQEKYVDDANHEVVNSSTYDKQAVQLSRDPDVVIKGGTFSVKQQLLDFGQNPAACIYRPLVLDTRRTRTMSFQITTTVTCYLLPGDGATARADFLKHLLDPGETWIIAYAFTLPDMIHELLQAHAQQVPLHIYLDHSQAMGKVELPLAQQLVSAGVEVTIGTSPVGSKFICHTKGIVSDAASGGTLWCWEGSTNFSLSAWNQVNTAMVFASPEWRDDFVAQFEALRDFAWASERDMQLMSHPPADLGKAPAPSRQRYGLKGTPDKGALAGQLGHHA